MGSKTETKLPKGNIKRYIQDNHNQKIYLDSQGRWRTYYIDPNNPTTMNSYCYDRHTKDERKEILEKALQG